MLWIQNKSLCQMCPSFQCDIVIYIIQDEKKKSKWVTKKESQENLIVNSLPAYQCWMKKM